jgi:hypothetical protein
LTLFELDLDKLDLGELDPDEPANRPADEPAGARRGGDLR